MADYLVSLASYSSPNNFDFAHSIESGIYMTWWCLRIGLVYLVFHQMSEHCPPFLWIYWSCSSWLDFVVLWILILMWMWMMLLSSCLSLCWTLCSLPISFLAGLSLFFFLLFCAHFLSHCQVWCNCLTNYLTCCCHGCFILLHCSEIQCCGGLA